MYLFGSWLVGPQRVKKLTTRPCLSWNIRCTQSLSFHREPLEFQGPHVFCWNRKGICGSSKKFQTKLFSLGVPGILSMPGIVRGWNRWHSMGSMHFWMPGLQYLPSLWKRWDLYIFFHSFGFILGVEIMMRMFLGFFCFNMLTSSSPRVK